MKKILTILRKELRRFFTDKRMVLSIFLPGILIYFVYSLMGGVMTDSINQQIEEYTIYVENGPTEFDSFYDVEGSTVIRITENLSSEIVKEKVNEGSIDLYIIYEEDFIKKINEYQADSGKRAPNIAIYYNSVNDSSYQFYNILISKLDYYESSLTNKFDINFQDGTVYDLATEEDVSVKMIGMILPFILMTFLMSGAMGICSESIAGEKERGTIATLLVTPVKRSHLVIGKIGALGLTTIASAFVSFIGLILSLPKLAGVSFSLSSYGLGSISLLLLVVVVTALFFTTILTIISTYAKSVKEATSLALPVMILVMVTGITGMMSSGANSNLYMYLIPIYNSIQVFSGILNLSFNVWAILITVISNVIVIGLGIVVLTRMFNSERIIFNK